MLPRKRNKYTIEFKKKAVELSIDPNLTLVEVAEKLDINILNLYRWRKTYLSPDITDEEQQISTCEYQHIETLEEKLKRIESERDVLTKAILIIGKNASM